MNLFNFPVSPDEEEEAVAPPQASSLVDTRTTPQAVASLLTPPKSPLEQARENHGGAGFMLKAILGGMTGTGAMLLPEFSRSNKAQYESDLELYNDQQKLILEQELDDRNLQRDIDLINNGIDDPGDPAARVRLMGRDGIGTIDRANWVLSGSEPVADANYQVVETNNGIVMVDKSNPNAPAIPLQGENGALRKPLPQHMIGQIGSFDRMVPRLQELDEMEQAGMSIPRSSMTALRAYETADATGQKILTTGALQNWMEEVLSPEQRQYILAAEDAGMIVLRDESGAAISASEILRQMNQYLIFDDLNEDSFEAQRNARNRKAKALTTGMPGYITTKTDDPNSAPSIRAANIEWVNSFDGRRRPPPQKPTFIEQEGLIPSNSAPTPFRQAPQGAVDKLMANPSLAPQFKQKYGYLPEGI